METIVFIFTRFLMLFSLLAMINNIFPFKNDVDYFDDY